MLNFFLPASKVQKDRRIMRETDARLAKYSRRGVVFNFFAFLLCVGHGRFIDENPMLMAILTGGLLLNTAIRAFYLFRFEYLYPRAPTKWRNHYFAATLLGAVWWGFMLVCVIIQLDMEAEAPLLLFYTVVFFSTTAHAFAPYQKFLSYYQFFGQVPAAAAAFYIGDLNAYIYGTILVAFYFMLAHQCRLMSENYWERLEATYALARKTVSIEEEKRDTKANVQLNEEFTTHLNFDLDRVLKTLRKSDDMEAGEFKTLISTELDELHDNIRDFSGVITKELQLEDKVFNIRHEIQHLVAEFVDVAEANGIQIETSLSPNLPMRLRGDASRLAQVIRVLLDIILDDTDRCIVLVEVEFLREYETAGELYVSVTRSFDKHKSIFGSSEQQAKLDGTLGFVVAKGLAELMDGSIEVNDNLAAEQQFRFNAKIDIAEQAGQLDFHKDSFSGKNVLLVHNHPRIVDIKRQELDALGFNVFTETQYKRAISTLENSYKFQTPIESLIFYSEPDVSSVFEFCRALSDATELKFTKKIAAATRTQQQELREHGFDESTGFFFVDKPTGLFEIESLFHELYTTQEDENRAENPGFDVVLISNSLSIEDAVATEVAELCNELNVLTYANIEKIAFSDEQVKVIMIDCDSDDEIEDVVSILRTNERASGADAYCPIVGFSRGQVAFEDFAYELGLDDYVDLTYNPKKTLSSTLRYWSTLF